jgi:hypothetical protein
MIGGKILRTYNFVTAHVFMANIAAIIGAI